ncbi:hypothetical protein F3Y22_tig00112428pilonHSYRG00021 [Hibiscus syriacus]|uniref:RDRP C-terminal head domain-containing protein n=1 Tax=Hibiscus syriacus TaxID=106335 RepID=A0A6A2WZN7_HIBSY|nr:hypothetical protein F3Y22_tig00112428pilonHSYRG00021 [Hibiscus syriacus]
MHVPDDQWIRITDFTQSYCIGQSSENDRYPFPHYTDPNNLCDDVFFHRSNYHYKLGNLMDYYRIMTEAEILNGAIMKMSRSYAKRIDAEAVSKIDHGSMKSEANRMMK